VSICVCFMSVLIFIEMGLNLQIYNDTLEDICYIIIVLFNIKGKVVPVHVLKTHRARMQSCTLF